MSRKDTKVVHIGDRVIGGGNPVLIQSMCNTKTEDVKQIIYGVAYKASKNVTYIASGKNIKDKGQTAAATRVDNCAAAGTCVDKNVYMLTAEVKW